MQVPFLGRAPRTKETLPDFLKWRRVTRPPLVFCGLTGSQRTPGIGVSQYLLRYVAFHILGTGVPSSLSKAYAPDSLARIIKYGPSQLGWNFLAVRLVVFSNNFLNTRSPGWNARSLTSLL